MSRRILRCVVPALLALVSPVAPGQPASVIEDVRFRSITVEDGLSQPTVRALLQDRRGFVWIGTLDGLNRSDGTRIRVYRSEPNRPDSLSDNHVSALVEDADGQIWVGTSAGGVNRLDPESGHVERMQHDPADPRSIAGNGVIAMAADSRGRIWIASSVGVLQWIAPGTRDFNRAANMADVPGLNASRDLILRRNGNLLVATRLGVYELDRDGRLLREWRDQDGNAIDSFAIAEDSEERVWIGSGEAGLYRIDSARNEVRRWQRSTRGLLSDAVRTLQFDASGRLWIGTLAGVSQLTPKGDRFRNWSYDPYGRIGLGAHRIESMMIDREGLVWIGTWANGVSLHDPQSTGFRLAAFRPDDPRYLPRPTVTSVARSGTSRLWVGMHEEGGIALLDPNRGVERIWRRDDQPGSLASGSVQTLLETSDGVLWVGTATSGLARKRPGSDVFEPFAQSGSVDQDLPSRNVADLFEDRDGNLWIAMLGAGVVRKPRGEDRIERFEQVSGSPLPIQMVNLTHQTADGALWFGLRSEGLVRYDPTDRSVRHFRPDAQPGSLSNGIVTFVHEDRRGVLWVGTQGGGLNRGDPDPIAGYRFRAIRRIDGLASDAIAALVEDDVGNLWISHSVGISRMRLDDESLVNYGWSEGAQSLGYFVGAVARSRSGEVYFGGLEGLSLFDPRKVGEPRPPRNPQITSVHVLGDSNPLLGGQESAARDLQVVDQRVVLQHQDRVVNFDFSAFNHVNPAATRYSYQLDGFDDRWMALEAGASSATFTGLPAGTYQLRVRAAGPRSQRWIESSMPLQLVVRAAPWFTAWAYLAYALLASVLGYWVYRRLARIAYERIEQQRQLRRSEEWLSMALESSGDEIWDADLVHGSLTRRNASSDVRLPAREKTGLQDIMDAVHPDDQPAFREAFLAAVKGYTERFKASFRVARLGGQWMWALSYGRVVERAPDGRALRLIGVSRDITEIMQHEEALQQLNSELEQRVDARTRDLQVANEHLRRTLDDLRQTQKQLVESEKMAALGALVAGVAHEINTPLGIGVTAASHLATESRRLSSLVRDAQMKRSDLDVYLNLATESSDLILRNLRRADHLVKSFKQVAVDQSSEQKRTFQLAEYLDEILTSLHPRLKRTHHEVRIDCDASLQATTYPGALYQVIVNLVLNSLVHGFDGIEAGLIDIIAREDGEWMEIEYRDNGRGMSTEVRERVFEPFFTTKRGQGGSGLGMHIVYNLVTQMMGGSVSCDSEPGSGVVFRIRFRSVAADAE